MIDVKECNDNLRISSIEESVSHLCPLVLHQVYDWKQALITIPPFHYPCPLRKFEFENLQSFKQNLDA